MLQTLKNYKQLGVFIVTIHLFYFVIALNFGGIYTVDSAGYLFQANNLVQFNSVYAGDYTLPHLPDYFAFRPPLYATLILVCKFFMQSDYLVLVVQNLLAIVMLFYVLHFLVFLGVKRMILNVCFPLFLFLYPAHFVYANTIMSDTIFEVLMFALLYHAYFFSLNPDFKKAMFMGLIIAISLLTKPVSILIGLFVCLVLLFVKNYPQIYIAIALLLPLTSYLSLGYAVKSETGYFQFTSMKSFVAVRCLVKYTASNAYGADYADSLCSKIVASADSKTSLEERFNYLDSSCNHFLLNHKVAFLKTYLKGCITFLFDPGRYDLYKLFNANDDQALGMYQTLQQYGTKSMLKFLFGLNWISLFALGLLMIFNVCVVWLFVLFLIKFKGNFMLKLFIAMFVMYFLCTTGVLGVSRYRVHVFPMLLMAGILILNQLPVFNTFLVKYLKTQD